MKTYKVKVKNNKRFKTIEAKSELEAKVLFCLKNGLNYSLFASKLEVMRPDGTRQNKTIKKAD